MRTFTRITRFSVKRPKTNSATYILRPIQSGRANVKPTASPFMKHNMPTPSFTRWRVQSEKAFKINTILTVVPFHMGNAGVT